MRWSIIWLVLAPLFATMGFASVVVLQRSSEQKALKQRIAAANDSREKLERAALHLRERHDRAMRRVRDSLLESRQESRLGILARTPEHYAREMHHHIGETHELLLSQEQAGFGIFVQALSEQLDRIQANVDKVVVAFENLVDAVATDDPDLLLYTTQEIHRADRAMHATLVRMEALARQAGALRLQRADPPAQSTSDVLWFGFMAWCPVALLLAYWPIRRMAGLAARGDSTLDAPMQGGSREELALVERLTQLQQSRSAAQNALQEKVRETDRAVQAARRSERELALLKLYSDNLVNSLSAAIVVTDLTGQILSFNRAARQRLDLRDEDIGTNIEKHRLYGAVDRRIGDAKQSIDQALTERKALRYDTLAFDQGTHEIMLDLTITPYLDESGAGRGLLWVADDVTDAVRIKNQLLAAERLAAVGRLSAQVAHEIRNPLSAIGLNAELLEEEFAPQLPKDAQGEAKELLTVIASEVERLTQVTESYLQLARLPRPSPRATDVNQVIGDLLTMLNEEMKARRIQVELNLQTPAPQALVDPGQLRQALLNITRNSREAMPKGGVLCMKTEQQQDSVLISISDTGEGMAQAIAKRIFEPFYSTKPEGTGLGLSLTQQIVREHGGDVKVESAPGAGTTLTIHLPAKPIAALAPAV